MPVFLKGLSLQFYRGIGPETQRMVPFRDFNFFIGSNNSGKSTVLNFISTYVRKETKGSIKVEGTDQYRGATTGQLRYAHAVSVDDFKSAVKTSLQQKWNPQLQSYVERVVTALGLDNYIWLVPPQSDSTGLNFFEPVDPQKIRHALEDREWQRFWNQITGQGHGSILEHWIPETLMKLLRAQSITMRPVKQIPAIRQIGPREQEFSDYSGTGLIDRLAEIQSPDHDKRGERELFDKINKFLQTVTDREDAVIEIPHHRAHVLVHMDNKVLPLSSLGMGIHEVIMIAAFCTISANQIICIEEPEIHLHPLLQRKLISYLQAYTTNQYFIATHSPSFIDTANAAIFHVTNDGIQTRISESILDKQKVAICQDLGIRASDIVQSNAIVWVEGPSDRIYLRHWLKELAPDLIEGIHFSIMFYGGRLLSHLSADDELDDEDSEAIEEFIQLRKLNQNLAIVIDSDKSNKSARINSTKQRLKDEFSAGSSVAWITKGREIENYIDHTVLQEAVKLSHPTIYGKPLGGGQFDHPLFFERKAKRGKTPEIEKNANKVKVANLVCAKPANLSILDLKERLFEMIAMIEKANS